MNKKFYNVYVTYGKNHSYMFSDNVPENLLEDYIRNSVEEIRRIGYKKQIDFRFCRPFTAYGINKSKSYSFNAYSGNGTYGSVYCVGTKDNKGESKEPLTIK